MATYNCCYSGLRCSVTYFESKLHLSSKNEEAFCHPIFYLSHNKLLGLYSLYLQQRLSNEESYLLYLSLLHSTGKVAWRAPATYTPDSPRIVANNIRQLYSVIVETDAIHHPAFKQPSYIITRSNSTLEGTHLWIEAWEANLREFESGLAAIEHNQDILSLEKRASKLILGADSPKRYLPAIAEWAAVAGGFPTHLCEHWKHIIRSCYNPDKMFSLDRTEIRDLLEYCYDNIEAGSLYHTTLVQTLKQGLKNHDDYLGFWDSTTETSFTLLDEDSSQEAIYHASLIADAPTESPNREDYESYGEYLRAKLAYTLALSAGDI